MEDIGFTPPCLKRQVHTPRSIIKNACAIELIAHAEDIPRRGEPGDKNFVAFPPHSSNKRPPYSPPYTLLFPKKEGIVAGIKRHLLK